MNGKGDKRRPCFVSKEQYDRNFEAVFGKKKLNVMSDKDYAEMMLEKLEMCDRDREVSRNILCESCNTERSPFWVGPGYRGEYECPHGVGHGNHIHGCCGFRCCSRDDFPLGPQFKQKITIDRPCLNAGD